MLKEEKEKRAETEQALKMQKERNIYRENQFRKIIEKFAQNNENTDSVVENLYEKILTEFDESNVKALVLMETKFEKSMETMDRKVQDIIEKTNNEIGRNRFLTEEFFTKIKK